MLCVFRVFDCDAIRCVACVAYDNLETACRPMKTDLKVGFQAAVRNATDATHTGHATQIKKLQRTQCMHTRNATDAIESVVSCVSCIFWFFDCKPCVASVAYDSQTHVGLCDIQLFTFSDESVDQQSDAT